MAPAAKEDPLVTILAKLEENSRREEETRRTISDVQLFMRSMDSSLKKLTEDQANMESWKPEVHGRVAELQTSMTHLSQQVELMSSSLAKASVDSRRGDIAGTPASAHLEGPPPVEAFGQSGHREHHLHRRAGMGAPSHPMPPPVKGAIQTPPPSYVFSCGRNVVKFSLSFML